MKKKSLTTFAVCVLCMVSLVIGVCAATAVTEITAELRSDFTIIVDGEEKIFENADGEVVDPILYDGTVYLPLRAIAELMGKTVYWYEDEKTIELKDESSDGTSTVTDADVIISGSTSGSTTTTETTAQTADSSSSSTDAQISAERALEIALEKAGLTADQVIIEKTEMDIERGVLIYEIEFNQGNIEYSADISAADGTIISWEIDRD